MADTESSVALILGKASAISIPVTCPLGPSSQILASFQAAYGVRPFKLRELLFREKIITANCGKRVHFGISFQNSFWISVATYPCTVYHISFYCNAEGGANCALAKNAQEWCAYRYICAKKKSLKKNPPRSCDEVRLTNPPPPV